MSEPTTTEPQEPPSGMGTDNFPPWWEAFLDFARRVGTERSPPLGCICPPGSEATCQGLACPRRWVKFT